MYSIITTYNLNFSSDLVQCLLKEFLFEKLFDVKKKKCNFRLGES